jgi:hypothetical protein
MSSSTSRCRSTARSCEASFARTSVRAAPLVGTRSPAERIAGPAWDGRTELRLGAGLAVIRLVGEAPPELEAR